MLRAISDLNHEREKERDEFNKRDKELIKKIEAL